MQIRLTVLAAPPGGQTARRACDVLLTAPAGTALSAVASGLAAVVAGPDGAAATGPVVLYAGRERLDAQRCALGDPPLVDGAVLALQVPADDDPAAAGGATARLHVVAGPDAGGVHLLHSGRVRIGRSADADVPLDDPDVSRLHCVVTVGDDARVTVADLGSTNGTSLDGADVGDRPVRLAPGALLRLGESTLRLTPGTDIAEGTPLPTAPDGEGHVRVHRPGTPGPDGPRGSDAPGRGARGGAGEAGGPVAGADEAGTPGPGAGAVSGRTVPVSATAGAPAGPAVPHARRPYGAGEAEAASDGSRGPGGAGGSGGSGGSPGGTGLGADPRSPGHARVQDGAPEGGTTHSRERTPQAPQVTPARGTPLPPAEEGAPRRRGIGAWARRLTGGRAEAAADRGAPPGGGPAPGAPEAPRGRAPETWPDPAAVLLTALGPGPRLWERAPGHPESLVVRLGTTDRADLAAVPVTVGLREAGSLGLAGPRARLLGLTRSVVAQLAALHTPADLEIVLIGADRARPLEERRRDWGWLGWLPHVRPGHGQDCRLLLAYDRDQAEARMAELTRRLDDGPLGAGWASADHRAVAEAAARFDAAYAARSPQAPGPYTVVVVDGDPGTSALRETAARLAGAGAAAGIHLVCLAETPAASAVSPVAATYEAACAAALPFRECGAVGLLSGDVATALRVMRAAGGQPVGPGTVGTVDAVSGAWAERFARALAPLRAEGGPQRGRAATALPRSARLLDELELARATPASLMARWASAPDGTAVLGTGPRGPLQVDLTSEGPHLLIEGPAGSGRTELLRSVAASLAAASRPDRLGLLLVDGAGGERGEGLGPCTDLPHVTEHLVASDPVRMRAFAQALMAELKRRAELLGRGEFAEVREQRDVPADGSQAAASDRTAGADRATAPEGTAYGDRTATGTDRAPTTGARTSAGDRTPTGDRTTATATDRGADRPATPDRPAPRVVAPRASADASTPRPSTDVDAPASGTLRLRPAGAGARGKGGEAAPALPRLVVLVDDVDALVAPALGSPGRPAAGSVVRALEAVARDGERLGVHLVAASARPDRTADTELARRARLRVVLDAPPVSPGPDDPSPGRGRLGHPDGRVTPFQAGRVTGRIPRTATLRPTVVPLEWERMGDPPARRPVRELGNGPTDLALLASALDRAARSVEATPVPPLTEAPSPR
ncbi:FtsK/SpoIIIE domain-containing protein [Streptomyces coeruleoprunus]|uniref:FtsK/SpoIIIE domain-containing protein n=1 Tax=Streptomyces coeruleoprunus TaxID=285563 RepID=A0ABV9XR34_9ACTN